ncbi:MAG: hypothetical protein AVDCRST_MAG85-3851, partial [uncultured Solirubrobacteraceae bacterium]
GGRRARQGRLPRRRVGRVPVRGPPCLGRGDPRRLRRAGRGRADDARRARRRAGQRRVPRARDRRPLRRLRRERVARARDRRRGPRRPHARPDARGRADRAPGGGRRAGRRRRRGRRPPRRLVTRARDRREARRVRHRRLGGRRGVPPRGLPLLRRGRRARTPAPRRPADPDRRGSERRAPDGPGASGALL